MSPSESSNSRSLPCNGKLISQLRKQLGWTQSDLARIAGFSERLIVKAEGGNNLSAPTLQVIATALNEAGASVSTKDLAVDPAALAKEFIWSMYQREQNVIDLNKDFISPDIVVHFAGEPTIFPFAGTHVGIEAARRAFDLFYSVIQPPTDHTEFEHFQFLSTGHGALVWGETWAHPIGMPMPGPVKLAIKMDFVDGLLITIDDRFDTQEGARHFAEAMRKATEGE